MQTANVAATTAAQEIGYEREPLNLRKRIGSTTYVAAIRFSQTSRETLADKVLRLARNNGLDFQSGQSKPRMPPVRAAKHSKDCEDERTGRLPKEAAI